MVLITSWSNGYVKFMVASAWPQMIPNLFVSRVKPLATMADLQVSLLCVQGIPARETLCLPPTRDGPAVYLRTRDAAL
jgi:hypothetical protein